MTRPEVAMAITNPIINITINWLSVNGEFDVVGIASEVLTLVLDAVVIVVVLAVDVWSDSTIIIVSFITN
jgi:hypothetical protein